MNAIRFLKVIQSLFSLTIYREINILGKYSFTFVFIFTTEFDAKAMFV